MKLRSRLFVFVFILLVILPAQADQVRENPSLYTFGEVVQKLPKMWSANPIEVMEMMKTYPDFSCWSGGDTISCLSNNNRSCAEVYVSLGFTGSDNYAEFEHATFTMKINNTEEIQKVIETFWIDDTKASNIQGAGYENDQVTIYFSNDNTLIKYSIPFNENGVWVLHADFGYVRG